MNGPMAMEFLRAVLPDTGYINLVAIDPEGKDDAHATAIDPENLTAAIEFAELQNAKRNIYWSTNPLRTALNKKAKKPDVLACQWLHVDLDDPSAEALQRLQSFTPRPTIIMFSGGGWQGFWRLRLAALLNGIASYDRVERYNKALIKALGGDKSAWNLDRVMRLPGTTNWPTPTKRKRGRVPAEARTVEINPELVYELSDFDALLGEEDEAPLVETTRSEDLLAKVAADVRAGQSKKEILARHLDHPHAQDQADPMRAVERCIAKALADFEKEQASALTEMNSRHAVINWKGRTLIMTDRREPIFNRPTFELSSPQDLKIWYANVPPIRRQNRAAWWLAHPQRRQFEGIVFSPTREALGYYNLWRGFAVQPRPGDCSLLKELLREVICNNNEDHYRWVTAFCADAVRNPADRPGVTPVFRGKQGTGKGTLARTLGEFFGDHFLHVRHSRHLVGNFNAHLANVLLLFADEAFYAGDRQAEGALKALITEPTLPIEFKGKDLIVVQNHVRIIMASNQDWVVPAAMDDRRFAIFDVSDKHANDTTYFKEIYKELDNGGREAWLQELMEFDLSSVDLRKIPATRARLEQQIFSATPLQKWWFGRLRAGAPLSTGAEWPDEVPTGDMFDDYAQEAGISGTRFRGTQTEFGIQLKKLVPGLEKRKRRVTLHSADGRRPAVQQDIYKYVLPSLVECRKAFSAQLGREDLQWPGLNETGAADRRDRDPLDL